MPRVDVIIDQDKKAWREGYVIAIAVLEDIQANHSDPDVRKMAKIVKETLKLLRRSAGT